MLMHQRHTAAKRQKITLSDYDHQSDIAQRLLMSSFSTFDAEVLEEILMSSLTCHLTPLAEELGHDINQVRESVDKLSQTGLLKRTGDVISVNKEMRKYYEFQSLKFDDDFVADQDFLSGLLKKVPIHVLPNWYALPRAATNIVESIRERYLKTPRIYQRYLLELNLEDPILKRMIDDVFNAPDFKVRSKVLRERYDLSREKFEEYMLLLEFSFVCVLSYNRIDDQWKEVVTPFHEWRQFLTFLRDSTPKPVETSGTEDFAFAKEIHALIHEEKTPTDPQVMEKAEMIGLLQNREEWEGLSIKEIAIAILRHPSNRTSNVDPSLDTERNLREVEKSLSRIADCGYVLFEDYFKGLIAPIGSATEPTLEKKGRRWQYSIPSYTEEEKQFIHGAIFERLYEAGIVNINKEKSCFSVTPFGRSLVL